MGMTMVTTAVTTREHVMIEHILFTLTLAMVITATFKYISIIVGKGMTLPKIIPGTAIDPSNYYIWYPALFYQISFWTIKLEVLV